MSQGGRGPNVTPDREVTEEPLSRVPVSPPPRLRLGRYPEETKEESGHTERMVTPVLCRSKTYHGYGVSVGLGIGPERKTHLNSGRKDLLESDSDLEDRSEASRGHQT